jgi:hypothetical protein
MVKRGMVGAAARGLIAKLVQENELNSDDVAAMLDVYVRICRVLKVTDPADPLSNTVARTVIHIAQEGERDPQELYKRALSQLKRDE